MEQQVVSLKTENKKQTEDFQHFMASYYIEKETIINRLEAIIKDATPINCSNPSRMKKLFRKKRFPPHKEDAKQPNYYNLSPIDCGLSMINDSATASDFGQDSEPGDWPWMAHITLIGKDVDTNSCGGFLISDSHILTAAHCFDKLE